MKSICITGANQPDLQIVADILGQAGIQYAKHSSRDKTVGIEDWHEQVLTAANEDSEAQQPIEHPGRLWEQVAGDIFLANGKSKVWGWADSRSTWLLNYWSTFDPHLNFLLVCMSPRHMLARAMAVSTGEILVDAVMQDWLAYHQELLRFYHRNPKRSLLVDAENCINHPLSLIALCAKHWKLPIRADEMRIDEGRGDALALYLAEHICSGYPELSSLHNEILATIVRLGNDSDEADQNALSPELVINAYQRLHDAGPCLIATQSALKESAESSAALHADMDRLKAELTTVSDELTQLKKEFEKSSHACAAEKSTLETRLRATTQENELLLVQLHQVQEELEQHFLKLQDAQTQAANLTQTSAALINERAEFAASRDALQNELAALTAARDDTARQLAEAHKLADERQTQVQKLIQERDTQARYSAELAKEKAELDQRLKESEQENELILLQLHQVQEEFENYYLKYQEGQKLLQAADARWQRVFERNPGYCDFESIEVLPGDSLTWRIRNLSAAGRNFPTVEFSVIMEQNIAGFVFRRQPNTTSPLIRWPVVAADCDELVLIPVSNGADAVQRIEALQDLAASDWDLLKILNRIVTATLANPGTLALPEELKSEAMETALANLAQFIEKARGMFCYDRVSLKREQADPNIEHLWLRFENLGYGGKRWPEFEFRLASVMVEPTRFGTHPRLEFPEACSKAFDAWFIESSGDYGNKLELRFALPDAMDLGVWQRLSDNDRDFITALIKRLSVILDTLRLNGVKPQRAWEDWIKVVRDMQHIISLRSAPASANPLVRAPRVSTPSVPTPPKQAQVASPAGATAKPPQTAAPTNKRKKVSTK